MSLASRAGVLGALAAIVAFFLPWAQYEKGAYSAADLAAALGLGTKGLGGFAVAPLLIPLLALAAAGFLVASTRSAGDVASRTRVWAASSAAVGLVLALLFLGSAAGGIAGETAVGKALGAGAFRSLGAGVYLAIAGFFIAVVGALLHRAESVATRWRTQDLVLLAVLAVVFGAVYTVWLQPWLWVEAIAAQPGTELFFGVWFTGGLLGAYVIRRPGAAFLAETLAAVAEVLLGAAAGPILVVTGMMEALGAELVFAATGYRAWGWSTMVLAGAAAALVALPWNWLRLGYFSLDPVFLVQLLTIRLASGGAAGVLARVVGDLLAATGSLNQFALGRERTPEV